MEKSKETKLIGVIASIFLLCIVGVASFAYFGSFNVDLNNNVAVNINAVSPGNASFVSSATQLNLQVPAANMSQTAANNTVAAASNTATLTVNLTRAANLLTTCTYDIVYEYDDSSNVYGVSPTTKNGDKEITIQVSGVNGTNNFASEKNFDSSTISSYKNGSVYTLVSGATIESDGTLTTQNISITGKYYNLTISQSSLEGRAFTGKIYVTNNNCETIEPAYITLLNAYGGKDSITELPESSFANYPKDGEKGMYKTADDLGTSYYYRGYVNNNWVKFGKYTSDIYNCNYVISLTDTGNCTKLISSGEDIYWRIIRINGDNTIRMIYSGTINPSSDSGVISSDGVQMNKTTTSIGISVFNNSKAKAEYVGYQYIEGQQHGYGKCDGANESCTVNGSKVYNSVIKQALEQWYTGTTLKDNDLVADQIFCNDRSASINQTTDWASTGIDYEYGAHGRLFSNKKPILTCPTESDKFTVNTSNGNGALTYPVGLITADEVVMAGFSSGSYLFFRSCYNTGSPYSYSGSNGTPYAFVYYSCGSMDLNNANSNAAVHSVISLASTVELSGEGTYTNPYTVS